MSRILQRFGAVLRGRNFFKIVLGFFVLEAVWIALSAAYPQAFDEDFHFGLIKIYSHYWLPFISHQPPDANAFGAVPRDPSYLYQYLMSFPFRLIALAVHGQTDQIIIMRFINIALAVGGLILFRRVLLKAGLSHALANASLLLFILIPVVPQLAGQINYDNLLLPLVAWTCLLAMQARDEIAARRPTIRTLLTLVAVCAFASLVKYEFLPIAAGTVIFILVVLIKYFRGGWPQLGKHLLKSWHGQSFRAKTMLILALTVSLGLFVQRDGINIIKYHALMPDCGKVLNVPSCSAYGPWDASYTWHNWITGRQAAGEKIRLQNPIFYTGIWLYWLWFRLFFAISGPANGFQNYPPLPLPAAAAILLGIIGIAAAILKRKPLLSDPYSLLFIIIIAVYLASLWITGYLQYRRTDVFILMNGRYLLPILLPFAALVGKPLSVMLRHKPTIKLSLAVLVVFCFLQGGGVLTFILRSDNTWDWPNAAAIHTNNAARKILSPVIVDGNRYYSTPVWFFNR